MRFYILTFIMILYSCNSFEEKITVKPSNYSEDLLTNDIDLISYDESSAEFIICNGSSSKYSTFKKYQGKIEFSIEDLEGSDHEGLFQLFNGNSLVF